MTYKRIVSIFIILISISFIGYGIYSYIENYEERVAFDYYQQGDYRRAEKVLKRVYGFNSSPRYILDLAYIARDSQSISASNELLSDALQGSLESNDNRLALEIYLNQAYNGYLEKNTESSSIAVANAAKIGQSEPWVRFFQGLNDYSLGNYDEALKKWNAPIPSSYLSSWMEKSFSKTFTMSWLAFQIARCNIEGGNLNDLLALENGVGKNPQKELNEVYFMLGLASIKEAESHPIDEALPYWKQAFSYFNKIPYFHEKFAKERSRLLNDLYIHTKELIKNGYVDDLPSYIQIFEQWKGDAETTAITSQLIDFIQEEITQASPEESIEIANYLDKIIPPSEARQALYRLFESELNRSLVRGNQLDIQKYWQLAVQFHPNQNNLEQALLSKLEEEIPQSILQDDIHVTIIAPVLEFWNALQTDQALKKAFEQKLLNTAFAAWENGAKQKGLDVVLFVSKLNISDEMARREKILQELRRVYSTIESQNQIDLVSHVMKAAELFSLEEEFSGPERIAVYLEDAQDLFHDERYNESKKKSQWILQLDPNNGKAKRILEHSVRNLQIQDEGIAAKKRQEMANKVSNVREQIDAVLDGKTSFDQLNEVKAALIEINRDNPSNPDSYYLLGQALFLLGDHEDSVLAYRKSLQLEPNNLEGYKYLALAQIRLGNLIDGVLALKTALQLYPEDIESKELLLNLIQDDEIPNIVYYRLYQLDPVLAESIID